jgi:hypothetical protein
MHSRCASGIRLSDRLRSAVFGNVGSIVACRLGEEDAAILARQIGLATSLKLSDAGLTSLQGMPVLPVLTSLDLSRSSLTSLQGMPALPELKLIDITELKLDGFDQLKSSPKLEKIIVTRGQIDLSAVPEELRRPGVIEAPEKVR